jgi:acyl-coenzyme A synthetase/AMP-(fatty) acid ligase/acyl carrier protein
LILEFRPTILCAIPSFFRALLKEISNGLKLDLSSVRLALSAGEPLPRDIYERFHRHFGLEILDGLGSTEMLQTFISNRPGSAKPGSCGLIVPNYQAKIVAENQRLSMAGEPGELWVRGETSFLSYWNNRDLTTKVKVDDWVRTGDMVFEDAYGFYHFCGRSDDRIKRSGLWVSLAEIESALCQFPAVEEAAVRERQDQAGEGKLVGYVVISEGTEFDISMLWRHVRSSLQGSKIPAQLLRVPALPRTPNGKIDERALSLQATSASETASPLPFHIARTATETILANLWSQLLRIDTVRHSDNFTELGGDSISAMQCIFRIQETFDVELPLDMFFDDTVTLGDIGSFIDRAI